MADMRVLRIARLAALAATAFVTMSVVHAGSGPAKPLPPQSKAQIVATMKDLLRRLNDLSAYIEGFDKDGRIVLYTLKTHQPMCGGTPPKATFGKPVVKDNLARAERALEIVNSDLESGRKTETNVPARGCLK